MKIGIFGGTFNPPHLGHVKAALEFYDSVKLDKLMIMPTFQPPHKEIAGGDDPLLRFELTKIAFGKQNIGSRNIIVSDYEIKAGGKSYTYQTLSHFANENDKLYLLCGSDMFLTLDCWRNSEIIFSLASIVCQRRENDSETGKKIDEKAKLYREKFNADIYFCNGEPLEISSTELREMIASEQDTSLYLDGDSLNFIVNHGMYGNQAVYNRITKDIRPIVGGRINHIISCKDEADAMADALSVTGYDKFRLLVSALLHDITHKFTFDEQIAFCRQHNIELDHDTISSPNTIHSITGAKYAKLRYPEFADDTVADIIASHTVGCEDMSVCQKILCLADYTEKTRRYKACQDMRKWFWDNISIPGQNKNKILDLALWKYFDSTAKHVIKNGENLNNNMIKAQKHLENSIKKEYNVNVYDFWYK